MDQIEAVVPERRENPPRGERPWTLWRQPIKQRRGLGSFLLGRQDLERLTSDQRHRAQMLRIEIECHPFGHMNEEVVRAIGPIMGMPTHALRFADLQALEKAVFSLRPAKEIEQSLPALTLRLAQVDPAFDLKFLSCKTDGWDETDLRAAAKYAITMVYEKEAADIVQSRKRYDLLRFTGNTAAGLALFFLYLVAGRVEHRLLEEGGHLLITVMVVGGLGGIMSSFVTLGTLRTVQGLARSGINTRTLKFSVLVHLIGGFVFSMVMFMLLLGGFVEGTVLPDMKTIGSYITIKGQDPGPLDFFSFEMAKLMVWAFISGYVGGLIPSQLAKIGRSIGSPEKPVPTSPS
jgi:hypothetical protein